MSEKSKIIDEMSEQEREVFAPNIGGRLILIGVIAIGLVAMSLGMLYIM